MDLDAVSAPGRVLEPAELKRSLSSLDRQGYWRAAPARTLALFVAFTLGYAVLAGVGYATARTLGDFVAFWPAAGLLGGVMVATPPRTWPLWLTGAIVGRFLTNAVLLESYPSQVSLAFGIASALEALAFAALLTRPLDESYRLRRPLYFMTALCVAAAVSSALGALIGAGILVEGDVATPFAESWRRQLLGDYLGLIIVAPLVAWLVVPPLRVRRRRRRAWESLSLAALTACVIAAIAGAATGRAEALAAVPGAVEVLAVAPLVWAAVRFPFPVVAGGLLAVAVAVNWSVSHSDDPLILGGIEIVSADAGMQLYLVGVTQLVLYVAFTVLERARAAHELRLHRRLERVLVGLSGELVRTESGSIDAAIDRALEEVAAFAGADRCILLQSDPDRRTFRETHGWYGPRAGDLRKFPLPATSAEFPWARRRLREDGYFILRDVDAEAPGEFAGVRRDVPPSSAMMYLGLFTDGELTGCIGLDWLDGDDALTQESGGMLFMVGQLFANVLKRVNAERTVADYQSKLRSMARQISLGEERARRRAAVDLHDGIGQNLAVARMTIGRLLAGGELDEVALREARDLVDSALRSTRHIIADLSPAILYELGLVPAIRSLAERFEPANDIRCNVEEKGDVWTLPNDLEVELYRIVRELLTNVGKHAEAATVSIRVDWTDDAVGIAVEDDGVGFDAGDGRPVGIDYRGFGIFSVREGVHLMGGTLAIDATPGVGTRVRLRVPRPQREAGP